jgi:hypothetical protein
MPSRPILLPLLIALSLWSMPLIADERADLSVDNSYASSVAAEIEIMRVRLGSNPSLSASATLMEADDLLRRFRQAPGNQKASIQSQLDSAMARAELELNVGLRK